MGYPGFHLFHADENAAWYVPVLIGWSMILETWGLRDNRPAFAWALLPTLAAAYFSYRHFEAPMSSWVKQRFRGARLQPILTPADPVQVS